MRKKNAQPTASGQESPVAEAGFCGVRGGTFIMHNKQTDKYSDTRAESLSGSRKVLEGDQVG